MSAQAKVEQLVRHTTLQCWDRAATDWKAHHYFEAGLPWRILPWRCRLQLRACLLCCHCAARALCAAYEACLAIWTQTAALSALEPAATSVISSCSDQPELYTQQYVDCECGMPDDALPRVTPAAGSHKGRV